MTAAPVVPVARDASFRAVQRRLGELLPQLSAGADDLVLERTALPAEQPRLIDATPIEAGGMRAQPVLGQRDVGFVAFLDGTQGSRILGYDGGVPVVHATVAAVIRERRNRRMITWRRPIVRQAIYAPLALLSSTWRDVLRATGDMVVDTTVSTADESSTHPFAVRDAIIHRVQKDRERAEQDLAEQWCREEDGMLYVDGGISGSEAIAVSACTVGVVKSHRTLYASGAGLATVLRLSEGERSSVFRITSPRRTTVASWYLRTRDPRGHDPMWGLVRVEMANPERMEEHAVRERADRISRWILAETAPLALPDARWDKMVYGIRDCEEFLRSITS